MLYFNTRKVNDDTFAITLKELGRDIMNYYTLETDRVLVEANSSMDGGKIYFNKDSWLKKGDTVLISEEWYLVSNVSKLASEIYNVGVVTRCDTFIQWKLGKYVYDVPCIASKYSGTQNTKGIIDDSVEGKLSFITGYHKELDLITKQPFFAKYGNIFKVYNLLHNDSIMNIYTEISDKTPQIEIGMSPLLDTYVVGQTHQLNGYILKTDDTEHEITYKSSNTKVAIVNNKGLIRFIGSGRVNFTVECEDLVLADTSSTIIVTKS